MSYEKKAPWPSALMSDYQYDFLSFRWISVQHWWSVEQGTSRCLKPSNKHGFVWKDSQERPKGRGKFAQAPFKQFCNLNDPFLHE